MRTALAPTLRALAPAVALALALPGCSADRAGAARFISIGTGGTGGIYYPLGGALASLLSAADPGRRYTAEVTGASVENVNRLRNGQIGIGMAIGTTVHEAYHGGTDFPDPHTELRILAPLYPNYTHVLVRRGVDSRSIAELKGRRVSVGPAGGGTEQLARQLLEAHGLSAGDVDARYLSFSESSAALRDGSIDAAVISVGYPAAAVLEAATQGSARLLPIDGAGAEALLRAHPYYRRGTIPAGAYPGVDTDVPTVTVMNWVIANASLPDDVADHLLDILEHRRDELIRVHDIARQIDLSAIDGAPIPLHPAIERRRGAAAPGA